MNSRTSKSSSAAATNHQFGQWEKTKDLIDQLIDIILNSRQSGHPGGSRSKVYVLLATLLSGVMRWDIRDPGRRFADRFVLGAGHTIPLVYCTLAVLNEALRIKHAQTGDPRYLVRDAEHRALTWEHLLGFRHRGLGDGFLRRAIFDLPDLPGTFCDRRNLHVVHFIRYLPNCDLYGCHWPRQASLARRRF